MCLIPLMRHKVKEINDRTTPNVINQSVKMSSNISSNINFNKKKMFPNYNIHYIVYIFPTKIKCQFNHENR